jgi:hypothetical protein
MVTEEEIKAVVAVMKDQHSRQYTREPEPEDLAREILQAAEKVRRSIALGRL